MLRGSWKSEIIGEDDAGWLVITALLLRLSRGTKQNIMSGNCRHVVVSATGYDKGCCKWQIPHIAWAATAHSGVK